MTNSTTNDKTSNRLNLWLMLSVIAMILGGVTGFAYYSIGGVMGPVSDAVAFIIGATLIPVTLGIYHQFRYTHQQLSLWARIIGIIGHSLIALSGLALVFSYIVIDSASNSLSLESVSFSIQLAGALLEGAWLLMIAVLSSRVPLKPLIVYSAYIAGAGNILFVTGTFMHVDVIAWAGGFLGIIAFITWAIRYRHSLTSRETFKDKV